MSPTSRGKVANVATCSSEDELDDEVLDEEVLDELLLDELDEVEELLEDIEELLLLEELDEILLEDLDELEELVLDELEEDSPAPMSKK